MSSDPSPEPRRIYDAFISYSHAADNQLAPALQHCLHRLAKRWYQAHALRVFRDEGSLSANPDLWVTIENALRSSRYFILLASPEAARSGWVQREISFWQEHRERDTFLIALADGEIHWDADAGDFDWRRTTALPEQLRGWLHAEPLWVDLAWARSETQLSPRHVKFRDRVGSLAACLHGIPKDELDSEDIRQHRLAKRLRWAAITGLVALLVIALLTAGVALQQRLVAEQQRSVAEEQRKLAEGQRELAEEQRKLAEEQRRLATGRALLAEAENLRETRPQMSLRLSLAALRVSPSPQARLGLLTNLMNTRLVGSSSSGDSSSDSSGSFLSRRITEAVFSRDGRTLATVDRSSSKGEGVTLWDVTGAAVLTRLAVLSGQGKYIEDVAFSADGRTLATAADDDTVILWELTDRNRPRRVATLTDVPEVAAVAFSPDGMTLATVSRPGENTSRSGSFSFWHLGDRARPRRLVTRTGLYDSGEVVFSPNGRLLLTSTGMMTFEETPTGIAVTHHTGQTLWDISNLTRPRELARLPLSSEVHAFSPDSRLLVTADGRNAVLWDISSPRTPKPLAPLVGHIESITAVEFSPDGRQLATTAMDGTAILWDLGEPTRPSRVALPGHTGSVEAVAFSPDGLTVSTADSSTTVTRWHSRPPQPTAVATLDDETGVGTAAAFSPDDRTLATVGNSGNVLLWDVTDSSHPVKSVTLPGRTIPANAVAFSADGTTLASAAGSAVNYSGTGTLTLWDVTDRKHPHKSATEELRTTAVTSVAFSPRGTTLVAIGGLIASGAWGALWDVKNRASPKLLTSFSGTNVMGGVAFRPDGKLLAIPQGHVQLLWELSNPSHPVRIPSAAPPAGRLVEESLDNAKRAAFSPDGRLLATTHDEDIVVQWDVSEPELPHRAAALTTGHTGQVNDIGYHPGGNLLATAGEDGTARLWDVADLTTPNRVATLEMRSGDVRDLAFSANGRWLVTSSSDGLAQVWELGVLPAAVADATGLACRLVSPGLSAEEWEQYVPGIPYEPLCQ